jgi:hypothetical protein
MDSFIDSIVKNLETHDFIYISGGFCSGKSTILELLFKSLDGACLVDGLEVEIPTYKSIYLLIDNINFLKREKYYQLRHLGDKIIFAGDPAYSPHSSYHLTSTYIKIMKIPDFSDFLMIPVRNSLVLRSSLLLYKEKYLISHKDRKNSVQIPSLDRCFVRKKNSLHEIENSKTTQYLSKLLKIPHTLIVKEGDLVEIVDVYYHFNESVRFGVIESITNKHILVNNGEKILKIVRVETEISLTDHINDYVFSRNQYPIIPIYSISIYEIHNLKISGTISLNPNEEWLNGDREYIAYRTGATIVDT